MYASSRHVSETGFRGALKRRLCFAEVGSCCGSGADFSGEVDIRDCEGGGWDDSGVSREIERRLSPDEMDEVRLIIAALEE